MKVIDLLNKIANDEITELHKFKWDKRIWEEYSKFEEINNDKSYQEHKTNGVTYMSFGCVCDVRHLNDEIEIIEEKPKKIEELEEIMEITQDCFDNWTCAKRINQLNENQKKIIKAVNYLLEKESDK